jgi:hypothetical protein
MSRQHLAALSAIMVVLAPAGAAASDIKFHSREYKLILEPGKFDVKQPRSTVGEFWNEKLTRIIVEQLDKRKDGTSRHRGHLDDSVQRHVVFRDTRGCALNDHGYIFRERIKLANGQPNRKDREVTLKFRTPDLFLAAAARPRDDAKAKFEEDIAPLLVRTVSASGDETAAFVEPPLMRSLFSVSISRDVNPDVQFSTLEDVTARYRGLKDRLERAGMKRSDLTAELVDGGRIHELVFAGAFVDLGNKLDAEFDLTLWYREGTLGSAAPVTAELSFKYGSDKGTVTDEVARRALRLFTGLQARLGDWASPQRETKTSIALPTGCR